MSEEQKVEKPEKTESDLMWEEISKMPTNMFAVPNKTIGDYVERMPGSDEVLVLKMNASAALAGLEDALLHDTLGNLISPPEYSIETGEEGYAVIKKVKNPIKEEPHATVRVVDGMVVVEAEDK